MSRFVPWLALLLIADSAFSQQEKGKKVSLEEAYQKWKKELTSEKKADRQKALESMLPRKRDVEHLFPKHSETVWALLEKQRQFILEHQEQMAAELAGTPKKGGQPRTPNFVDLRKSPPPSYKKVLGQIPKDVPVFEIMSISAFVYVNDRWMWFPELDSYPPESK